MSEDTFADLFQEKSITQEKLQPGDKVNAVVAGISGENIFLDVGGKSEGVLLATELRNDEDELTVVVGL